MTITLSLALLFSGCNPEKNDYLLEFAAAAANQPVMRGDQSAGLLHSDTIEGITINLRSVPGKVFYTGWQDLSTAEVTADYWIAETEVTYQLWNSVYTWAVSNGYSFANPGISGFLSSGGIGCSVIEPATELHPVICINWRDAMVWTNALTEWYNLKTGAGLDPVYYTDAAYLTPIRTSTNSTTITSGTPGSEDNPYLKPGALGFRLPTHLEWELAARYIRDGNNDGDILDPGEYYPYSHASGADAPYWIFSGSSDYDRDGDIEYTPDVAIYSGNSGTTTASVRSRSPNPLGLYDMGGNVLEWLFEWSPSSIEPYRIRNGGSFANAAGGSTVAGPGSGNYPYYTEYAIGFRIVRSQ